MSTTSAPFKVCSCGANWPTREAFLADAGVRLVGYQVDFEALHLGLLLFNHLPCRTTLALEAGRFRDLAKGPVYLECATGGAECPGHCLHQDNLEACPARCECAWVRDVLDRVRRLHGETPVA